MNNRKFRPLIFCVLVFVLVGALISGCSSFPNLTFQKEKLQKYHDSGKYEADIQSVIDHATVYVKNRTESGEQNLAIVLDIDETSLTDWDYIQDYDFGWEKKSFSDWIERANAKPIRPTLQFYRFAKKLGIKVFFITGRTQNFEQATVKNLNAAGYENCDGVFLKPVTDHSPSVSTFKTSIRRRLSNQGLKIIANIGDQDSDLKGGFAERVFKLPDPFYYSP